jgi:signal transduction histidine kinase/ActR/RegA family two-component response regulator
MNALLNEPVTKPPAMAPKEAVSAGDELRVLILAPVRNDARLSAGFLEKAGLTATICADLEDLQGRICTGCGALLLAEEALATDEVAKLAEQLERQPSWSDLPLILITAAGDASGVRPRYMTALSPVGNISVLERPVRPETLVSTCEVGLRARRRQYQVRGLLHELDAADRRKDEFLAMLAHELRNPLAAVANAASLLINSSAGEDHEWAKSVIARQSSQLAHLIDDLLDVSRITAGKIRLRKEVIDVATVLDRARDSARPLVSARKHNLICNYSAGALWLDADPTRLEQVVLNLLTNAAKYTPAGGRIELSARPSGGEILIAVRDNGIGIAPEHIPEMFRLFAQGERIEAQSGGINGGSVFTVCLPAAAKAAAVRGNGSLAIPKAALRRVLIVDDNVDTAHGLARLLARAGHEVVVAHNGSQALERARELSPHAVVLDIGLPGMDGFEVVQRLRKEACCSESVIIAVTGYGKPEDRERALDAGFDYHMVKPVAIEQLKALLQKPATQVQVGLHESVCESGSTLDS